VRQGISIARLQHTQLAANPVADTSTIGFGLMAAGLHRPGIRNGVPAIAGAVNAVAGPIGPRHSAPIK